MSSTIVTHDLVAHSSTLAARCLSLVARRHQEREITEDLDLACRVQSRERLLTDVWEMSSELETRTVDTHVKRLREKLGPAREMLETVRGVGYRLLDPADGA